MNSERQSLQDNQTFRYCLKQALRTYWRSVVVVGWPLILLPAIIFSDLREVRCAVVISIMAVYWMTETLPLGVTSLLPVVLFPILGILDSRQICDCYMNDTIMVFLGGLILAIAIEHCNLHMRIALIIMKFFGCSHIRLLAGLSVVTTLASMWISNTATCALMLPIIFAILEELEKEGFNRVYYQVRSNPEDPNSPLQLKPSNTTKAYLFLTAYCSTFGGTTTLVGTGTNLTLKGIYEQTFPDSPGGITFTQWSTWAIPPALLNIFLTWLYVQIFFLGLFRPNSPAARAASIGEQGENVANQVIKEKYSRLGPISFHESSVGILFLFCVILWVFRAPGFMTGWAELISAVKIKDSTPVILITILLFCFPKEIGFLKAFSRDPAERPVKPSESLITWNVVNSKMPWNLMFLLGGGFAISRGSDQSCLSKRIGESLASLGTLPPFIMLLIICLFVGTMTEITSNIGIANIILPVVAQMSIALKQHPLYLMIPAAMCCSYSFRFPVGTPPNAIISAAGHIPIKSMLVGGCGPSIYSFLTLMILFPTWGIYVYDIRGFPTWASSPNNTRNVHCD